MHVTHSTDTKPMTSAQYTCRICHSAGNHKPFAVREMMFGTRDEFEYFQCQYCGCLQIADIPKNLNKYYPTNYTSHSHTAHKAPRKNWLAHQLQKQRTKTALFERHYKINRLLKTFVDHSRTLAKKPNDVSSIGSIIKVAGIKQFDARILDVGCGAYSFWLTSLQELGFKNLVGIDPLIPEDKSYPGIHIIKSDLVDFEGEYELITLHHALEHIEDQDSIFREIERHLTPDGVCLIRIPIIPSMVWEKYKTDWVELDPPRHLYIHTRNSMEQLANRSGMEIFQVDYDSTAFEFYGSELYQRNIPLTDPDSPWINPKSAIFSKEQMEAFKSLAHEANIAEQGGRAAFFLRKTRHHAKA